MILTFWGGLFSGAYVSFREGNYCNYLSKYQVPGSSSRDLVWTHSRDLFRAENVTSIWQLLLVSGSVFLPKGGGKMMIP